MKTITFSEENYPNYTIKTLLHVPIFFPKTLQEQTRASSGPTLPCP